MGNESFTWTEVQTKVARQQTEKLNTKPSNADITIAYVKEHSRTAGILLDVNEDKLQLGGKMKWTKEDEDAFSAKWKFLALAEQISNLNLWQNTKKM